MKKTILRLFALALCLTTTGCAGCNKNKEPSATPTAEVEKKPFYETCEVKEVTGDGIQAVIEVKSKDITKAVLTDWFFRFVKGKYDTAVLVFTDKEGAGVFADAKKGEIRFNVDLKLNEKTDMFTATENEKTEIYTIDEKKESLVKKPSPTAIPKSTEKPKDNTKDDKDAVTVTDDKPLNNNSSGNQQEVPTSSNSSQTQQPSGSGSGNTNTTTTQPSQETACTWQTVVIKEAWSEQVLSQAAWDEQVISQPAWDEPVYEWQAYYVFDDGYICYDGDEAVMYSGQNHTAYSLRKQKVQTGTIHHDAVYETVHHDAIYTTIEYPAETQQVCK